MLTDHEILQFKRNGYLVKRGIVDKEYCATACERLWDDPPPSLSKDDPDSWIGPIKPEEESEDPDNFKKGYRWQYRKVSTEPWMRLGWGQRWARKKVRGWSMAAIVKWFGSRQLQDQNPNDKWSVGTASWWTTHQP